MFEGIQFESVGDFLQMGRYTFHVWSVYLLFTVFIFANLLLPRLQRRQFIREQKRRAQRDAQMGSTASTTVSSSANSGGHAPGESV